MQPFEGFARRAVVIVPEDEEYKKRLEGQQKVEGKEVPESAIYEMKGRARHDYSSLLVFTPTFVLFLIYVDCLYVINSTTIFSSGICFLHKSF